MSEYLILSMHELATDRITPMVMTQTSQWGDIAAMGIRCTSSNDEDDASTKPIKQVVNV